METRQINLLPTPIDKREAEKRAHIYVREKYGNLPSVGEPILEGGTWRIPIEVRYPRVLFEKGTNRPKKVRYMNLEDIGEIRIDANKGDLLHKPRYWDVRREIEQQLNLVQVTVQKALVKTGADRFSKLPFSEHMHTPVADIIAYLLITDPLDFTQEFSLLYDRAREKYNNIVETLTSMDLVRRSADLLIPGNVLVEIERKEEDLHLKLSDALAYFFVQGYQNIQSVHQVLGPHLTISGYIYQQSVEYDDLIPLEFNEIEKAVRFSYGTPLKQLKLPRYLIQLEEIGVIEATSIKGEDVWTPEQDLLDRVRMEEEILLPIRRMFIKSSAVA